MTKSFLVLVCASIALTACQTASPQDDTVYVRTDGISQVGRPDLQQQFQIDSTVCIGEAQKAAVGAPIVYSNGSLLSEISAASVNQQKSNALNDVVKGCMAQKGYILVKKSEAVATAQRFRANVKK
ncbi:MULTISPECIES: hypothetical protein [unclassified Rhizobium]|uniref:hypothetical protein n=1 Tax=unclassified Rhizobium TaxID=2613769 RepID=UPI00160ADBC8|nr:MULTISPECIES: hypothetical protein [unclassified Rhizobium]MBB3289914.1 hypothetical protein [Rhizobium sp. BK252]MBB3404143.1 hypothetical protein [Rhizobium sp. BK289]MBB3417242.1 hypothetical protein [Rhizobium sp. BK284]MBB3485119.1 hypothetical protein [Rhizobium sp. BK347]